MLNGIWGDRLENATHSPLELHQAVCSLSRALLKSHLSPSGSLPRPPPPSLIPYRFSFLILFLLLFSVYVFGCAGS